MKRAGLALIVLVAAAFGLGWWLVMPGRANGERGSALEERSSVSTNHEEALLPASGPAATTPTESSGSAPAVREAAGDSTPRAPVHGRLVCAEDGTALEFVKLLLLSSEGDRVSESLLTDERGRFTTTRAFPRGELRVWVREPGTKVLLTRHGAPFEPGSEREWLVPVPEPEPEPPQLSREFERADSDEAHVRGRVSDRDGRPYAKASVQFFPEEDAGDYVNVTTGEEGGFAAELEPSKYRLLVRGRLVTHGPVSLWLAAGATDLGDIVLPVALGGSLSGEVHALDDERQPFGIILVRQVSSGREFFEPLTSSLFCSNTGNASFQLEGLPVEPYELSFLSIDGQSYAPARLEATPPASGLRFTETERKGAIAGYRLDVRTAVGEPVTELVVLGRVRGQWLVAQDDAEEEFPPLFDEWIVLADGFRPQRGRFDSAQVRFEEEGRVGEIFVQLTPGYGRAWVCKDVEGAWAGPFEYEAFAAPLAGVELRVDGQALARSDASGMLLLDLAEEPRQHELARPGWRCLEENNDDDGAPLALFARQSP